MNFKYGFSYKKPRLASKGNPDLQKEFVKFYETLINKTSLTNDPVLFDNSVHPSQQTRPSYGWIKKGQDKIILTTAARKHLNIRPAA